jgi:hypothetical protein
MFLQRFALTIWHASTDALSYVTDFGKRRTGSALGYLYALSVTLAFFGLLPFAIGLAVVAPSIRTLADDQLAVIQRWYPDELVLTLSGDVLSTNVQEPYALDLPTEWGTTGENGPTHAIVIDTSASVDDFAARDTAILLTRTYAVVKDDNGVRTFDYAEADGANLVINETLVSELTTGLSAYTPMLPWIAGGLVLALVLVLPWIGGGFMWLGSLFFLLWATVITWIISAIVGRGHRYGELYRLSLFGITNSMFLSFALTMTSLPLGWATYLLFFGWMTYVIVQFPRRASASIPPLPPAASKAKADKPVAKKPVAKKPRAK